MLILTLKETEKILFGDKITVMVVEIRGKQIRLGIEAPEDVLNFARKIGKKRRGIKEHRRVGQAETPGAPPGHRPDPTPTERLPPAVPTPCTMTTTARPWYRREGAGQNQSVDQHEGVVTILGVAPPGPPCPPGRLLQGDLHLRLILSGQPTLDAQPSPRPWVQRLSPRRHRHRCPLPWGIVAPLRPRPCP
jgi:carbon storage regulator CsrA